MFRIKPLDHRGIIDDYDVPHNQISFLLSFDYFPYLSVEQIKNYFIYIEKCLRPGGEAMIHITDADNEDEWKSVVAKKVTYCNGEIIKDYVNQVGLEFVNSYPIDSGYTFFHFKKKKFYKRYLVNFWFCSFAFDYNSMVCFNKY